MTANTKNDGSGTAISRLEDAVDRLLAELAEARAGAAALASAGSGKDPANATEMALRIEALEGENQDLRDRLSSGRGVAERLVAKIRFLEEKK